MATGFDKDEILSDYRAGFTSRQASLIGRKEVLTGKAKFGIFGDGKEVAQLALARVFQNGDFRSGYYRDQTFMFARGMLDLEQFFAQLYADPDPSHEPASSGRQMNGHFSARLREEDGSWRRITEQDNTAADLSPVGSQMPRLVGLAQASRLYRELDSLAHMTGFSNNGNEVAFGTIGNASCAEGMFWEAINAVGVLGAPMVMSIWDDGYGISVPNEVQLTKGDLSALLSGFQRANTDSPTERRRGSAAGPGYDVYAVKGWDYAALRETYEKATAVARESHVPSLIHVVEMTQPQGHSTSGSHERYKSKERLQWEDDFDCLERMRQWMLDEKFTTEDELKALEAEALEATGAAQRRAWTAFRDPIREEQGALSEIAAAIEASSSHKADVQRVVQELDKVPTPLRRHLRVAARELLFATRDEGSAPRRRLIAWLDQYDALNQDRYSSHLHNQSARSALEIAAVAPSYPSDPQQLNGYEVLNHGFDQAFARVPELVAFGEDVGKLGDVNQGLSGMQDKYGELRVSDTGIRECTIVGQAIGLALRGIRPIAEIQYLDYILYALQLLSDDLATLSYRTRGGQMAPVIIRTRGHRLEGIWHSGSLMGGIIHLVRGIWVCVPRNMTQAAGFYNTLLASDDSAIVVEVLNGYRLKERLPDNVGEFRVPLGVPEILRAGGDVTIVTYGASCAIAAAACDKLAATGIDVELIDVQTLLPFDRDGIIARSLEKTNRIVFLDEDVPGGTTAYMMQQVLEAQGGYDWLDSEPRTLSGAAHRPAYGSDGDYWSKPNVEDVFDAVYELMHEAAPSRFPLFYR